MLPVIILKRLVPQQQVPEAIARWKWRHLCIHLGHLKSWDIQNNARVAAIVLLQSLSGGPVGWRREKYIISLVVATLIMITTLSVKSEVEMVERRGKMRTMFHEGEETKLKE